MKRLLYLLVLALITFSSKAQDAGKSIPITIGYYGHFAIQPGIKVGTEFKSEGIRIGQRDWLISPQFGFFSSPKDDNNLVINLESGFRKVNINKHRYNTFSVGLAYWRESKLTSFAVNLGSGNTESKEREGRGALLPTLSYTYGWGTHRNLSWYAKYSVGPAISGKRENVMAMFIELGIKFNLNRKD